MQIGGPIIISMKTIIFILAISALAAPIFTAACSPAITGCDTCATGGTVCNKASVGYYLMGTPLAPVLCGNGKGKDADAVPGGGADAAGAATTEATACTVTCTGAGANACGATATATLSCKAGYYLSAAGTCSWCPSGKGKPADTTVPTVSTTSGATECSVTCPMGAFTCSTTTAAINCKAGYFLSAAGTCSVCPLGKGKAADTTVPAVSTTSGATECGVTCTAANNCQACSDVAGTCVACAAGRYLETAAGATQNTCVACTAGCKTCTASGLTACPTCDNNFYYSAANTCMACPAGRTRTAPATAPTAPETDSVCTAGGSGSSATLIRALCGASVAAYALF